MSVWLVRSGKFGDKEALALESGLAVIGFQDVPNLGNVKEREDIMQMLRELNPKDSENCIRNYASQLFAFSKQMKKGDIAVMPLKQRQNLIALGIVNGDYRFCPNRQFSRGRIPKAFSSSRIRTDRAKPLRRVRPMAVRHAPKRRAPDRISITTAI